MGVGEVACRGGGIAVEHREQAVLMRLVYSFFGDVPVPNVSASLTGDLPGVVGWGRGM